MSNDDRTRRTDGGLPDLDRLLSDRLEGARKRIEGRLSARASDGQGGLLRDRIASDLTPRFAAPDDPDPARRWAIAVGINGYAGAPLTGCMLDARAMHSALAGTCGYPPDHVDLLTDDSTLPPTRTGVLLALSRLAGRLGQADVVLFHFSGHGFRVGEVDCLQTLPDPESDEPDFVAVADVQLALRETGARRIVMVVDACRVSHTLDGTPPVVAFGVQSAESASRSEVAYLQSCRPGETSGDAGPEIGGVYTHFLVRGLTGEASPSRYLGGPVTLSALQDYVFRSVAEATGGKQHPQITVGISGDRFEDFVVSVPARRRP